jgi:uncharacterized circularly permuted ATP-grasp superfamily protein
MNDVVANSMLSSPIFDEMRAPDGSVRAHYRAFADWLERTPQDRIAQKRGEAERIFHRVGITFAVYGEQAGVERLIPFDLVPRIIPADEWARLEAGLAQRVRALNLFLGDIYHAQSILSAGVIPAERVLDNLRVPSGVSYMLENRKMMMRLFPELFATRSIRPVQHYPDRLLECLHAVAPAGEERPTVAVLTPGAYNSAYFEHAFLAQQMGVELCEGRDLFVHDDTVYMWTTRGPQRVHVIYRRVDDDFLDPLAFRPDSILGVPGLFSAYRAGRVTLANAIGTGVADDKSIYPYVPDMIRFYLSEEPLLDNVPTLLLYRDEDRANALANLERLVIKEAHGAGGYGMLIGPASTASEREGFRQRILAAPDRYIAQPTLALSTCPTFVGDSLAPRHIDFRPYVLSGKSVSIVPGGLTRVALREGSLVVNSSQGGGTKDTWVLAGSGEFAGSQAQSQSQGGQYQSQSLAESPFPPQSAA